MKQTLSNTIMKLFFSAFLCSLLFSCETLSQLPGRTGGGVTEFEASQGIREALTQGVGRGINFLNRTDGFFGSEAYKLFLPPDAKKVETALRRVGMGAQVDKAILQINRAAEDAVGFAKPIFVDAIREMTVSDAINIIRGPKDAATMYFRDKTKEKLIAAFMPSIRSSLDKMNATKYYGDIVNTYNSFPTTFNKINPDLPSYVVGRAVDALFDQVAKEEMNIRENPVARTTEILKKVFGSVF